MARTTFSGPVKSNAGFEGDLVGNSSVTGNLSVDGNLSATGSVSGTTLVISDGASCDDLTATGVVIFSNIPTSDPQVAGRLWSNLGVLTVSAG